MSHFVKHMLDIVCKLGKASESLFIELIIYFPVLYVMKLYARNIAQYVEFALKVIFAQLTCHLNLLARVVVENPASMMAAAQVHILAYPAA